MFVTMFFHFCVTSNTRRLAVYVGLALLCCKWCTETD